MMMRFLFATVSLFTGLFASPSQADAVLAGYSGVWKGDGWITRSQGDRKQAIRCRVVMRYLDATGTLAFSGRCGGAGNTASFSGDLSNSSDSIYRGEWSVAGSSVKDLLIGKSSGRDINFQLRGSGRNLQEGEMRWSLRGNGLTISSVVARSGREGRSMMKLTRKD